jgi:hypothetical protein
MFHPSHDTRIFGDLEMGALQEVWLEREELGQPIRDMAIYEKCLGGLNATLKHITIAEYFTPMPRWITPPLNSRPRLTYQDMAGVLGSAQHLTSLYLCPRVFLHPLVLDKMATGELLPLLEKLGVSSVSGWDVIWMIQRKNIASALPQCGTSSDSAFVVRTVRPVALSYLCFYSVGGLVENDKEKLEEAIRALGLLDGYSIRHIDTTGEEPQPPTSLSS